MRAVRVYRAGGPEVLQIEDVPVPSPADDEVLVRHRAIGVNFIDTYHRSGLYPTTSTPWGLGVEAAGVVETSGPNVEGFEVGDRVAYVAGPGSYAEFRCVPASRLIPLPDTISHVQAAAMMVQGMTAEYLVRRTYPVSAETVVLLHAAAGGVGLFLAQWLRALGATVIGTVGTDEKATLARAHGCRHTIVYTREDVVSQVQALTDGAGVHVAYDSVGRATFAASLDCLRTRGTMVSFGNASGPPEPISPLELGRRGSLFLTRPSLFDYIADRNELLDSAYALFDQVALGAIAVNVHHTWPLAEAADAHRALEARQTTGSIVLTP